MQMTFRFLLVLSLVVLSASCDRADSEQRRTSNKPIVSVSLLPQKYFADRLSNGRFDVQVLVPAGASPETFEPSVLQLKSIAESKIFVLIDHPHISFEREWLSKMVDERRDARVIRAVDRFEMDEHDPHVWLSPRYVLGLIDELEKAFSAVAPEYRAEFKERAQRIREDVARTEQEVRRRLEGAPRKFLVFHPAWGYFAEDFDLEQIAIEEEGKEPSAVRLMEVIKEAREAGIKAVFVQPQFPEAKAKFIADELGARVVELDPLAYDWPSNMLSAADTIAGSAK